MDYRQTVKVQEEKGKKIAKLAFPPWFQGHTFAVGMSIPDENRRESGEYRVEYVLGNSFVNEQSLQTQDDLREGFSNLVLVGKAKDIQQITCCYESQGGISESKVARVGFAHKEADMQIRKIWVILREDSMDSAVKFSGAIVQQFLDILSYKKFIPLDVRRIEVFDQDSNMLLRSYVQFPYTSLAKVSPKDLEAAADIPDRLRSLLRMFREAMNSSNVFYRCLCLYRLFEGLKKVQASNTADARGNGKVPRRNKVVVPRNDLMENTFPDFIGKSLHAFLDHVRKEFRLSIAHLNIDEYEKLLLDPGIMGNIHLIDQVNAVLLELSRQSIQAEWRFMLINRIGIG